MTYSNSQGKAIPEHLWRLGLAVRMLIVRYNAMDPWKRHVRGWVNLVKERAEKPNYTGVNVMDLLLSQEVEDNYALLAAVHDNYASPERNEELIHPWAVEADFTEPDDLSLETLDAIATYVGLKQSILCEQTMRSIERSKVSDFLRILRVVDDDIRSAARLLTPDRSIWVDESVLDPVHEYESFLRRVSNVAEMGEVAEALDGANRETIEAKQAKTAEPTSKSEKRAKWLAQAMLLVRDHPDWPNARIAKSVGVNPGTLSRSREYQAAAAMARGDKADRHKGHIAFDPQSGQRDVEAYFNDPVERDLDT